MRPLGIASLEDKIVQHAVRTVLQCIYEEDFLGFSYGFRPNRSPHNALDALAYAIPEQRNVFLHYVFDLWINQWRKRHCRGKCIVVRYADDFVIGFENESEARACLESLQERLQKFGLELHPEKTRLLGFWAASVRPPRSRRPGAMRDV